MVNAPARNIFFALFLVAGSTQCSTISQSGNLEDPDFNQFDPSLGTLESVSLELTGTVSGFVEWYLPLGSSGLYSLTVVGDIFSGDTLLASQSAYGDVTVVNCYPGFCVGDTAYAEAGPVPIGYSGDPGLPLAAYVGTGQVTALYLNTMAEAFASPDSFVEDDEAYVEGTAVLQYTYDAATQVPEPSAAYILLIGGLWVLRRRSK